MIVRELITKLGFKVDDSQVKGFKKNIENLKKSLRGVGKAGGIAVAGLALVTAGVVAFAFKWSASVDTIGKTSRKLGVASDELQKLQFAAQISGASAEQLTTSVRFLLQGMFDARTKGVGPLKEGFDEVGLSVEQFRGKNLQDTFSIIADAINKVPNKLDRTAIRLKIFGRQGGVALGELLNLSSKGIKELTDNAEELGGVISEKGFKAAADFADAWTRVKFTFGGLVDTFQSEAVPAFTGIMDIVRDFIVANKDLINTKLEEWVGAVVKKLQSIDKANVKKAFKKITSSIELAVKTIKVALIVIGAMVKAFKFIVDNAGGVAGALGVISIAMGALTATVVALGVALGIATGGLSTLLGLAATAAAATAGIVALSRDTLEEEKDIADELKLIRLKKRKRLVRGGGGITDEEIDVLQAKVDASRKARTKKIRQEQQDEQALQVGLSKEEQQGEQKLLDTRLKQTGTLSVRRNAAILKERKARVESDKKRKTSAKKAAAERLKESKASLESLKAQAAFLVEDEAKAFFQDLLEEGVAVAEASARTAAFRRENISKVLETPSTIARRVTRKKEADRESKKGANLLKTLTGGRLTSKRLGTAAKQGFGAQVLRININYHPTFNTPVTLRGSTQPIEATQLASIMKESVGVEIDKRNAQEFRDIINASQES